MSTDQLTVIRHLAALDAKLDAQKDQLTDLKIDTKEQLAQLKTDTKEQLADLKSDVQEIKSHVELVKRMGKLIGMGSGAAACVKLFTLFF